MGRTKLTKEQKDIVAEMFPYHTYKEINNVVKCSRKTIDKIRIEYGLVKMISKSEQTKQGWKDLKRDKEKYAVFYRNRCELIRRQCKGKGFANGKFSLKTASAEMKADITRKRVATFKKTRERDKRRLLLGLEQLTKLQFSQRTKKIIVIRQAKNRLRHRGYFCENQCKEIYYDDNTNRTMREGQLSKNHGFVFLHIRDKATPVQQAVVVVPDWNI